MSSKPSADEVTRWALRAGSGDVTATALFIRATQADVWRVCAHLGNRWAADDLTQEVYLRAHRSLPRFRGDSSARTWLLTIARRVCADHVREQQRRPALAPIDELLDPADPAADHAGYGAVRDLLERLDPERKEAFVLTQVLGLSYQEAADVSGCPIGTIRSRVARARDDLAGAVRGADRVARS